MLASVASELDVYCGLGLQPEIDQTWAELNGVIEELRKTSDSL
jgi:hypothetical protein